MFLVYKMHPLEIKSVSNFLLVNFSVSRAQVFHDPSMYTDRDMKVIFSFSLSKESGSGEDDRRSQPRR